METGGGTSVPAFYKLSILLRAHRRCSCTALASSDIRFRHRWYHLQSPRNAYPYSLHGTSYARTNPPCFGSLLAKSDVLEWTSLLSFWPVVGGGPTAEHNTRRQLDHVVGMGSSALQIICCAVDVSTSRSSHPGARQGWRIGHGDW